MERCSFIDVQTQSLLFICSYVVDQAVRLNDGVETEEMASDRQDIEDLLVKQKQVMRKRDEEAAREVEADKLQVISCMKHLSFRAKTVNISNGEIF